MKSDLLRKCAGWLTCAIAALAICIAVILYERSYADWALVRMVCDGCFVAGVMFTGLGVLSWISNFGGFTALGYAWYLLVRKLSFSKEKFASRISYLEYVQQRKQKQKNPTCVFVTGLVFIAAAVVCLLLYRQ